MSLEESVPPTPARDPRASGSTRLSAGQLADQLLEDGDRTYVSALRKAGLIADMDEEELLRIASELEASDEEPRRVEILELYYAAAGDGDVAGRRRKADRFFAQRLGEPATAAGLVKRLAELTPELADVGLERIGGVGGPLALRAGEHFSAVLDEDDDITLDESAEERARSKPAPNERAPNERAVPMVTVRGLVGALNVLLDKSAVRSRFVALRGDREHEVYVFLGVSEAMVLARQGHLEDLEAEDVMELAAW